jgi:hypothetical protein
MLTKCSHAPYGALCPIWGMRYTGDYTGILYTVYWTDGGYLLQTCRTVDKTKTVIICPEIRSRSRIKASTIWRALQACHDRTSV